MLFGVLGGPQDGPLVALSRLLRTVPIVPLVHLVWGRKVQPQRNSCRRREVERGKCDALIPQLIGFHAQEAREPELEFLSSRRPPGEFSTHLASLEIQFTTKTGELAPVQVQDFAPQFYPGGQPIHGINHEACPIGDSLIGHRLFQEVLFVDAIQIAPNQSAAGILFVEEPSDAHVFVAQRKQGLRDSAPVRMIPIFDDLPGVNDQISVLDLRHRVSPCLRRGIVARKDALPMVGWVCGGKQSKFTVSLWSQRSAGAERPRGTAPGNRGDRDNLARRTRAGHPDQGHACRWRGCLFGCRSQWTHNES